MLIFAAKRPIERMINRFLKAKHWQIFLTVTGIPIASHLLFMAFMAISMASRTKNMESMHAYFMWFPVPMAFSMLVLFGWFWSLGIGLQAWIPAEIRPKTLMFKLSLLYPAIYIPTFFVVVFGSFLTKGPNPFAFLFIAPFHLTGMVCMFYLMYFLARTIKTVELQRATTFSDFAGEFMLIWMYPIGIWVLQPKINKLMQENGPSQMDVKGSSD
jgi:hypothetical protein